MTHGDWICQNTSLRGRPFTFDRYPFQKQIADDMHPSIDVMKISQVGLTEVQIRKALAILRRLDGFRLIFTLPNGDMQARISTGRVKPIIDDDEVFNSELDVGATRTGKIKQFGRSFLYLTGSSEGDATSIDADAVFNDEVDLTDQNMLALFSSRLQNSDYRISQRFSTPTHEGYGISKGFEGSDQHYYLVKCDACNHYNDPVFDRRFCHLPGLPDEIEDLADIDHQALDQIELKDAYVRCENCHSPLDLGRTDNREWVAKFPSRTHSRGYRIRPFSTSRLDINYIITQLLAYKNREFLRGWYNTVLGEPYTESNARLQEEQIKRCLGTPAEITPSDKRLPIFVGIDVGAVCHVVFGTPRNDKIVIWGVAVVPSGDLLDFIEDLDERFQIVGGAMDRLPYTPTAEAVRDLTNRRILPVQYSGNREMAPQYEATDPEAIDYIQADRTKMIDKAARHVRKQLVEINGYGPHERQIIDHLRDMVRIEEPEKPAVWQKLSGHDHFFHALAYFIFSIKMSDFVSKLRHKETRSTVLAIGAAAQKSTQSGLIGFSSNFTSPSSSGKRVTRYG